MKSEATWVLSIAMIFLIVTVCLIVRFLELEYRFLKKSGCVPL